MATLQRTRPKQSQASGTWSSVFPPSQSTEQQSAQFVKKLLAVALSNLTYLRAIFPEPAFGDRSVDGLHLKILRDDTACAGAWQLTQWIKGCFDALDRKYLRQLTVLLYTDPGSPDTAIETYTFRFTYTPQGGVTMQQGAEQDGRETSTGPTVSSEDTYKATIRMMRTIVVLTQTLRPLPDDVLMSMKLLYYDEVTPPDYEPPGFRAAETHQIFFQTEPMNVRVGDVGTPFHSVKLRLKTDASQFDPLEAGEGEETVTVVQVTDSSVPPSVSAVDHVDQVDQVDQQPSVAESVCDRSPGRPASGVDTTGTPATGLEEQPSQPVLCSCGVNEDDGLMVLCELCHTWQHGICYLILREEEAPASHVCDTCALKHNQSCTDSKLTTLPQPARMATCLYRRGLCACEEMSRVQPIRLAQRLGVDQTVAQGLMNRLEKDRVLKPSKGKGAIRTVDRQQLLYHAFPRYLNRPPPASPGRDRRDSQAVDDLSDRTGKMGLVPAEPEEPGSGGAGDGPQFTSPSPPARGKKRRATPVSQPGKVFEIADSQEFEPDPGRRSKKYKASRTDGIPA